MRYHVILIDNETGETLVNETADCVVGAYHNDGSGSKFAATDTTCENIIITALAAQNIATIMLHKLQEAMKDEQTDD